MAKRCGRGKACFARMNVAAVFGCQPRQVEHAHQSPFDAADFARDLQQPPTLRHFAWAGVLAPRRAVDDQDAGRLVWIVMLALSLPDRFMRGDPVFSQVVVRVGEIRACLPGARGLAMVRIAVPCRSRDAIKLGPQRIEAGSMY